MVLYIMFAAIATIVAETFERAGADKESAAPSPILHRTLELLLTLLFAGMFQVHTFVVMGTHDNHLMALSAVFGALVARIAISDARNAMIPDEIVVPTFAILPIWKVVYMTGAFPDPVTVTLLAAGGVAVFLLAILIFGLVRFFPLPPPDLLLVLLLIFVPHSFMSIFVEAGILLALLVLRRAWPPFGHIFMSKAQFESMREDAATIFGDDEETASQDPNRYFPMAPFAIIALFGALLYEIILGA